MEKSNASDKKNTHVLRIMRPLTWWFLLVLVLFGIRTHQRLREQTRLFFKVSLQGRNVEGEVICRLDDQTVGGGEHLSAGPHRFSIIHPKAEPFSTNFFVLYNKCDFGQLDLVRSTGMLRVKAQPPAPFISITGTEFSRIILNTSGTNVSVPTGNYSIRARYANWEQSEDTAITSGSETEISFAPKFGSLKVSCNKTNVAYTINNTEARWSTNGELPTEIYELPAGTYELSCRYRDDTKRQKIELKQNTTNEVNVEFVYGKVEISSEPIGATVSTLDGKILGETPILLDEQPVGAAEFNIERQGFQPARVSFIILKNETIEIKTNLVSLDYTRSMDNARRYLASGMYPFALASVDEALRASPNESEAILLKQEISELNQIESARKLNESGDYKGAIKILELALQASPQNGKAQRLLDSYKSKLQENEEASAKKTRSQNSERLHSKFGERSKAFADGSMFQDQSVHTRKQIKELAEALSKTITSNSPTLRFSDISWEGPNVFTTQAVQENENITRVCLIGGGPAIDDGNEILFKVLEFQKDGKDWLPLSPQRTKLNEKQTAQVAEGFQFFSGLIKKAIGDQTMEGRSTLQ